jgi:hypothetical protein
MGVLALEADQEADGERNGKAIEDVDLAQRTTLVKTIGLYHGGPQPAMEPHETGREVDFAVPEGEVLRIW